MSLQDDIKTALDNLFDTVILDELGVVRPAADTYLTNVITDASTPSITLPSTLAAESLKFESTAIGLLPAAEGVAVKDTAGSLKALIDLEADKLTGQLAGSTSNTAAIAVAAVSPAPAQVAAAPAVAQTQTAQASS